jgi:hypothetical protein
MFYQHMVNRYLQLRYPNIKHFQPQLAPLNIGVRHIFEYLQSMPNRQINQSLSTSQIGRA